MTRYADPQRCPGCGAAFEGAAPACPQCGLLLVGPVAGELYVTLQRADWLLEQLRATPALAEPTSADAAPAAGPPSSQWRPPVPAARPSPIVRRPGLSAASVPKILLSLGALCLLVAAIVFLAVAWSWLGVGGRTAVLITLTAAAGGLAWWLWRRDLRAAAESLSAVGLGMLILDVVGAESSGWLGDLSATELVILVGATVGVAGLVVTFLLGRSGRPLWVPQVVSGLGLWAVPIGTLDLTSHDAAAVAVATIGLGALAAIAHRVPIGRMWLVLGVAAGFWWLVLAGIGLERLAEHPSWSELWADLHAWPLVAAALLLLVPAYLIREQSWRPAALGGVTAGMLTYAVAYPASDSTNQTAVAALCAAATWAVAALFIDGRWKLTPLVPMVGAGLVAIPIGAEVAAVVSESLFATNFAWSRDAAFQLVAVDPEGYPALLPATVVVILLGAVALVSLRSDAAAAARRFASFGLGAVLLAGVGTFGAYAVPAAAVVGALLVLAVLFAAWAFARTDIDGSAGLLVALVVAALALAAALPSTVLTVVVLAVTAVASAVLGFAAAGGINRFASSGVGVVAAAALAWTTAEVAELDDAWKATPVLVLVGILALVLPRLEVEVPAAASGALALLVAVDFGFDRSEARGLQSLALHLTIAGVFVTATALTHSRRRVLAFPGGALLAMASWVRLYDMGVDAPEAYTLPSAVALVLVGLHRLRTDPESSTRTNLTPGLVLGTVPSLLQTFADDPVSLRPLLLGAACLTLVMAGTRLRWSAPLVVGSVVGALLVLRELGPYAADLPPWLVIAIAGTALTVVGITWERRLQNLREAGQYLHRLR